MDTCKFNVLNFIRDFIGGRNNQFTDSGSALDAPNHCKYPFSFVLPVVSSLYVMGKLIYSRLLNDQDLSCTHEKFSQEHVLVGQSILTRFSLGKLGDLGWVYPLLPDASLLVSPCINPMNQFGQVVPSLTWSLTTPPCRGPCPLA